ncbi:hypothetical protein ACLMJK_008023 [Lecanora helva]
MSFDLTPSISSGGSISSGDVHKPGIRDRLLAIKQKAALATVDPTDPAYADSFGKELSDLDGRRRWVLEGLALERWEPDLHGRVREILHANEGEIHKDWTSKRTSTVSHCWMLGYDMTHAYPTVVISSNRTSVLKRTMRIISQHGVLKEAKFVVKGIPFSDLKYRMGPSKTMSREMSKAQEEEYEHLETPTIDRSEELPQQNQRAPEDPRLDEKVADAEKRDTIQNEFTTNFEGGHDQNIGPMELSMNLSSQDSPALRVGAEEITVAGSGRLTTLGGFIMVDDVCFGLTAAHAFTDEEENGGFGQRSISESDTELHLYDEDWANDESSDGDNGDTITTSLQEIPAANQLQRLKLQFADGQEYTSETGELRRVAASSRQFSSNGLDWALCELGEWGKYAINGVYLPPELRTEESREYLIFKRWETNPPEGKVLVATKRGVISGHGTGSDTSIKLPGDTEYRQVWCVQLEESLTSGDSGSWVVNSLTGDVYGMVVAGSAVLQEEYIVPAVDIGQDIGRVMRAQTVRLPTWHDVLAHHKKTTEAVASGKSLQNREAIDWQSDEDLDDRLLDENEERSILAEILKTSSIKVENLIKLINDAEIQPQWNKVTLPRGLNIRAAQKVVDDLLSGRRPCRETTQDVKGSSFSEYGHRLDEFSSREGSPTKYNQDSAQLGTDENLSSENRARFEEPPELLDSNPNFRAEKSRRAWRAKKQAGRGPKPHHRKHHRDRKSSEGPGKDPVLKSPSHVESQFAQHQRKFELDSEDEQGNLDPDVILVRHKGSVYNSKFPAFSIAEGSLLVGSLRQQVARDFSIDDASRVTLLYKGRSLKIDSRSCHDEGLKMRSEVLCVVKRTTVEELEFLANKFRTELIPQGLDFMSNQPADPERRELEYRRISETILAQILLKFDAIDVEGDESARIMRKKIVAEVNGFLNDLDRTQTKDDPSDWHADFLPAKQLRRPSPGLPDRTESFNRSGSMEGSGLDDKKSP